jgi:hypothetical protein
MNGSTIRRVCHRLSRLAGPNRAHDRNRIDMPQIINPGLHRPSRHGSISGITAKTPMNREATHDPRQPGNRRERPSGR